MPRRRIGPHTMMGRGGGIREPESESHALDRVAERLGRALIAIQVGGLHVAREHINRALSIVVDLRQQVAEGYHRNPSPLLVIHNPPIKVRRMLGSSRVIGVMSQDVHEIRYTHADDGESYKHEFGDGVQMFAVERDGLRDIHLTHVDGKPLWEDFG